MTQKSQSSLRCLFCGKGLKENKGDFLSCPGCRATFRAQVDEEGCIIGLKVQDCGTPECCRHEKKDSCR